MPVMIYLVLLTVLKIYLLMGGSYTYFYFMAILGLILGLATTLLGGNKNA